MTPDHNSAAAFLRRVGASPWKDNSGQRSHKQRGCNDAAAALSGQVATRQRRRPCLLQAVVLLHSEKVSFYNDFSCE